MSQKATQPKRSFGGGGGPSRGLSQPGEKAKDFKGTFKRLLTYVKPYFGGLGIVFIFTVISTVFTIVSPKKLGEATTILVNGIRDRYNHIPNASIDFTAIAHVLLTVFLLYVVSAVFSYLQAYIMNRISQGVVYKLRTDIDAKLKKLPLKYFDSNSTGDVLSRVTNDVDTISTTLQQSLTQIITAVVTLIGILVMMLTINLTMTAIALLIVPLSFVVTIFIAKRSQKYFKQQQSLLGDLNGHIEESYAGQSVVKAFGREDTIVTEFDEKNNKLFSVAWKANFISGTIMPLLNFVGNIGYIMIAVVGALFTINYGMDVGNVQAFLQYVTQFTQPIVQTANIANVLQSTMAAAERVFELLSEPEEEPVQNPYPLANVKGEVAFENVSFGYSPDKMIIKNFNAHIKPGQTVAIVGPTGAGKTTIINLLMRFYDTTKGTISVDGIDIKQIDREVLRSEFGMVLQDTWLFNGSIYDNIAYGTDHATKEEVIAAAKAANVDHFVRTLQHGYDTEINEEASNISQGQKQLLTIARAILTDPPIMILDEATSSVDTRTEILIQQAMDEIMQGRTSFVIAHRLSTIKNADVILVMKDGEIIEQGSHQELLQQNGFYAELYNSQFSEEAE